MNKKYLIFGATGSIGSNLAQQMFDEKQDCHLIGRNEEELKEIQALNQKFVNTKVAIADAEVNKKNLVLALESIQQEFSDIEKKLIESYGENSVIDLKTGEVKDPEEVKETVEKK